MVTDLPLSEGAGRCSLARILTREYFGGIGRVVQPVHGFWHPDQSNLPERLAALRAQPAFDAGRGAHLVDHFSCSGVIDAQSDIVLDPVTPFVTMPETVPGSFLRQVLVPAHSGIELGSADGLSERVLGRLGDSFNMKELRAAVRGVELEYRAQSKNLPPATSRSILALAEANYEVIYEPTHQMSDASSFRTRPPRPMASKTRASCSSLKRTERPSTSPPTRPTTAASRFRKSSKPRIFCGSRSAP